MKKNQRTTIKMMFGLFALLIATVTGSVNAQNTGNSSTPQKKESASMKSTKTEQELLDLSMHRHDQPHVLRKEL